MRQITLAIALCLTPAIAPAQTMAATSESTDWEESDEPFVAAVADEAVHTLATTLEEMFVFPETGKAYAAMLRANLAAQKYAQFANAKAFSDAVTTDLQAVHPDGHLRVHVVPPGDRQGPQGEGPGPFEEHNGVNKAGWIAGGIAYIDFDMFPGNAKTLSAIRKFIDSHAGARTLIIDLRRHRGGGMAEMDVMFANLFLVETTLVDMDTRRSVDELNIDPDQSLPTLHLINAPEGVVRRRHVAIPAPQPAFGSTKIYVLTSKRTASAAEHFALALKRNSRATLIGETTYGAGNYGMMSPLDNAFNYAAFVPYGRTFDPDTGEGWEGVGIAPDIALPADQALDQAMRLAGATIDGESALAGLR